ncbi:hypothetical protein MY10362_009902, partial [Beauveria mimosiformis]
ADKKRTCVYEHTLFANHPRLRRAAAEMVSLIEQGKAIGAALDAFAPQPPPGPPGPTPLGSQVVLAPPPSRGRGAQADMGVLVGALTASLQAGFQTLAAEQRAFQENVMAALAPPQTPRRAIEYRDDDWQRSSSRRDSRGRDSSNT